jgi:hypothetical protein
MSDTLSKKVLRYKDVSEISMADSDMLRMERLNGNWPK